MAALAERSDRLQAPLSALSAFAALLALVECLDFYGSHAGDSPAGIAYSLIGLFTTGVGVRLWRRRPINATGMLLVVLGGVLLVGASVNLSNPWAALPGQLGQALIFSALLHVVLAFPSGRLGDRWDRSVVAAAYLVGAVGGPLQYVTSAPAEAPLAWSGHPEWADPAALGTAFGLRMLVLVAAVRLLRRWCRLTPRTGRGPVGLVFLYGTLALGSIVGGAFLRPLLPWGPVAYFAFQISLIGGFPLAVALAMRFGALARSEDVEALAAWFAVDVELRPHPQEALARALGDPGLRILYEVGEDTGAFVDPAGCPRPAPAPSREVGVLPLAEGHRRTLVVYDATLLPDPAPVAAAGRVVALAVDHARLTAELRAGEAALRASRRRIVTSHQEGRRRLAQDLHDGVQSRLVLAALRAGRLAVAAEQGDYGGDGDPATAGLADEVRALWKELDETIHQLRRTVEGVMPSLLREQGLFAALEDHVHALPVPATLQVEGDDDDLNADVAGAAYYIVTEAALNAIKHARATRIRVTARLVDLVLHLQVQDDGRGGAPEASVQPTTDPTGGEPGPVVPVAISALGHGITGILDRVSALDGRASIHSPAGRGTTVNAWIPVPTRPTLAQDTP